ncbi:LAGLIDADG family homing endonuclease [Haloplanus aerogenes]|uniref:DNA helicase n=1 Tax=Haloplanus aerogenes TaxID=660522 RepID=A0A3M0CVQ2_9EURY|nr:LAGLIDADG family homing endonuclease [Haloplanus aerogenes]AZH23860.1 MCM family protein [Haloplanus aerogenes]RMB13381.1 replicative DNA helicase Mcm [Haloplanus aerogenes]
MAQSSPNQELVDRFVRFYRNYYRDAISQLAQRYPNEQRSLHVDYDDLYQFDPDLAEDFIAQPDQLQDFAEEALRVYDLPADVSLGQAHVRLRNLPDSIDIRSIRVHDNHVGRMIAVSGIVRKATDVRPKIVEAAFECQRCGTMTYIPQSDGGFQEPHECQGCERQGPFRVNYDQSEFVDSQKLRVQESPEGLRGGETPQSIDIDIEDDITGEVTAGDHVTVTGVLHIDQVTDGNEKSQLFDLYMDGVSVEIEDEQFEDMEISEADKRDIIELSNHKNIYDEMVASVAPSIYGYDQEKLAMILQLFSGVTKHLPDGSRIRGDLHMLLIGDPGTGKCQKYNTKVVLGDGTVRMLGELVESRLENPVSVDDGVYESVNFSVQTVTADGNITVGEATKVWKREAPERMYRIRTKSGREVEVTPSHPLFVPDGGHMDAIRADELEVGDRIAASGSGVVDGAEKESTTPTSAVPDGGSTTVDGTGGHGGVHWDRIESIETVTPNYDWVYDLEVAETHTYLGNGIVSHNSQLLSYIRNIAPRSVYTSGKGSSSAGLCVTGDTLIHTADGFEPIRELVKPHHPEPVTTETSEPAEYDLYTFDRTSGEMTQRTSSYVWRMPEKQCRRIETAHGKELETSTNTPVLICGDDGIEWREISEIEAGDFVAVPKYEDPERSTLSPRAFFEFSGEKLKPDEESITFLRRRLREQFGTLRDAAAELELTEDFIYDSLSNRHLPLSRLDRILEAIDADRSDINVARSMLGHGNSITIPDSFDEDLMYLIGLVFGDGDIMLSRRGENRGHVRLSNSDEELLRKAARIVEETFDKSVEIEKQDERVPCIRIHSATIARFFRNLGMETPKDGLSLDPRLTTAEHADAFLRGLFDADGSVSARDDGGSSIQFSTISDEFARQVQLMLETYGVRARRRERDRRGTYELESGYEIESKAVQTHLAMYGQNVDAFAERIGFESAAKTEALDGIVGDATRRGERLPVGRTLAAVTRSAGAYYQNIHRGDNPSRKRARAMLTERDLGPVESAVREAVDANLVWDEVVAAVDTEEKELFDLTVPETNNFVGNGIVTHNTAAAVRDDFGEGQQWSLEAGALVLADQGIAAVDELDKMRAEDRSAMHQALEQQQISISKAGINATLKSRCSLLGAANPKYGRFDQYEPIGEQIDLEPALISRFDLIFTVTDQPDPDEDAALAEHILRTNYAGELNTQREQVANSNHSQEEVESVTDTVDPEIDPELLRKYIAYAKRTCFPTMTDEAKAAIRDFYVDLRAKGADEDAPVPVTARKLEALVRLAEASARVRLSDTVERDDAERVIEIVRSCLQDIGVDPETGEFDADVIETGTSKSQRDRIKSIKDVIETVDAEYEGEAGAPIDAIVERAEAEGIDEDKVMDQIEQLRRKGDLYSPKQDQYKVV